MTTNPKTLEDFISELREMNRVCSLKIDEFEDLEQLVREVWSAAMRHGTTVLPEKKDTDGVPARWPDAVSGYNKAVEDSRAALLEEAAKGEVV